MNSSYITIHVPSILKNQFIVALIFIILGFAAYGNAIFHPFVHDDVFFIEQNVDINNLSLFSVFAKPTSAHQSITIAQAYYRPLLEFFYRLQYFFFGMNPHGYHLFNIILHMANAYMIYRLLSLMHIFSLGTSIIIGLIFLLHPVQSEAVACISGISNLVVTFFILAGVILYLKSDQQSNPIKRNTLFIGCLLVLLLALLAKEQAIIMPFLIVAYEFLFKRNRKIATLPRRKLLSLFVVVGVYFFIRFLAQANISTSIWENPEELCLRILSIPGTLLMYFRLLLIPVNLYYYRSTDILDPSLISWVILIVIAIVGVWVLKKVGSKEEGIIYFGLVWFFVSLLPVLNIIPLINEYSLIMTAEHFLYFPMVGFFIALSGIFSYLFLRFEIKSEIMKIFFILLLGLFIIMTFKQNTYWKDEVTLFERTIKYQGNFGRVRILLAQAYYKAGHPQKAIEQYEIALTIMNGYLHKASNPQAQQVYKDFIKQIHSGLAQSYEAVAQHKEANDHYRAMVSIDPRDAYIYNNIALNLIKMGDTQSALAEFEHAVSLDPKNIVILNNLAIWHSTYGDKQKAQSLYREVLNIKPDFIPAQKNLELLLKSETF